MRTEMDNKGLTYWQTEYSFLGLGRGPNRDLGMTPALWTAKMINTDLTIMNAAEWDWWLSVSNGPFKDGLLYTDWKEDGDPENVIESKILWAFGNFSKFIRPGSKRVVFSWMDIGSPFLSLFT